ncbi:MAG: hypothetical protein HUU21_16085 [Polyangiaceae bacterium]|nr:hypothetical protein [Polyangiaceae bacterium]
MKQSYLSLGLSLLIASALPSLGCAEDSPSELEEPAVEPWSKVFGGEGSNPQVAAITTGISGNIALTGAFNGTLDFGAGDLDAIGQPSFYIAKLTAGGEHVWSGRTGGGNDTATSLGLDRGGDTIVTGYFDGELDLGTGLLNGNDDLFLAKFDAQGKPAWSRPVGDEISWDGARDIAVSNTDGSIHLTGRAGGTVDFGAGPIAESQFSVLFAAKLSAGGAAVWSRGFGSDGFADGRKIAVDKDGNTIVAGEFSGPLNVGGGTLGSFDSWGIFVMKLDVNGKHVWSKGYTNANSLQLVDVAVDPSGSVVLAGHFTGTADFGGSTLTSEGDNDLFLVKLGAGGGHVFSKRFGQVGTYPRAAGVAADGEGNLYLAGSFTNTIDLGGGGLVSMGADDVFWAKFTSAGAFMESRSFGDSASQSLSAMAADTWGNTVLAGTFYGSVDFGSGRIDAGESQRIFVARF